MFKTLYNSTGPMNMKLQSLKTKTKINFYKNMNSYYDEMYIRNFQIEQGPFAKNAQGVSKIYHEVML